MVNYTNSKILSVGDKINMNTIFSTTVSSVDFMKDMRKKHIKYKNNDCGFNPIFDIFDKDLNPSVVVLVEKQLINKDELKTLLEFTKMKYNVVPIVQKPTIDELMNANRKLVKYATIEIYKSNLRIVMNRLDVIDIDYFITNADDVIDKIVKFADLSNNTKRNYVKSVMSIIPKTSVSTTQYVNFLTKLQTDIDIKINNQVKHDGIYYKTPKELHEITKKL